MQKLESLLKQSGDLPALPEIYFKVSELIESEDSTAHEIGEAIQVDPSLTAKILKLMNSAFYGLPTHVTSISQAVSLLGRQMLKQILIGSVLGGVFDDLKSPSFSMRDFWSHSIKTAIIARHLAMQNRNIIDHEAFFTAGLLHDIGRLIIAKVEPDLLAEIDVLAKADDSDILQIETNLLGATHIDVGAALMRKWAMPSMLTQCLLRHHDVDHIGPFALETSIVFLANHLSKHDQVVDEGEMFSTLLTVPNWEKTDCSFEQIHVACQLADEQAYEVMESLGMAGIENSEHYKVLY